MSRFVYYMRYHGFRVSMVKTKEVCLALFKDKFIKKQSDILSSGIRVILLGTWDFDVLELIKKEDSVNPKRVYKFLNEVCIINPNVSDIDEFSEYLVFCNDPKCFDLSIHIRSLSHKNRLVVSSLVSESVSSPYKTSYVDHIWLDPSVDGHGNVAWPGFVGCMEFSIRYVFLFYYQLIETQSYEYIRVPMEESNDWILYQSFPSEKSYFSIKVDYKYNKTGVYCRNFEELINSDQYRLLSLSVTEDVYWWGNGYLQNKFDINSLRLFLINFLAKGVYVIDRKRGEQ